jgi:dipeptidyl-peptidase-3
VPELSRESLWKIAAISAAATNFLSDTVDAIFSTPPYSLGFPGNDTISNYYPGSERITRQEIALVSSVMGSHSLEPENTRLRKFVYNGKVAYHILQASGDADDVFELKHSGDLDGVVRVVQGDHARELSKVCFELEQARNYAANDRQIQVLDDYIKSFRTGSLQAFRESQKAWVTDRSPTVENMIGFVEPYRDPYGARAEWEGVVCISDPDETVRLREFVEKSSTFIRLLPWAVDGDNDGKGPFEKALFEAPEFTSVHGMLVTVSVLF